jgi:hypothetical protein
VRAADRRDKIESNADCVALSVLRRLKAVLAAIARCASGGDHHATPQLEHGLVVFVYLASSVAVTWPVAKGLTSALVADPGCDTGVYVWNLWVFWHDLAVLAVAPLMATFGAARTRFAISAVSGQAICVPANCPIVIPFPLTV